MNRVAKAAVCVCVAVRASAAAAGGAGEGDGSSFASGLLSVARAMAFLHARAWPGPSWRQLSEGAMRGMAQSVDDWSDWLAPEEEAAEAEAQEGRRVGAGVPPASVAIMHTFLYPDPRAAIQNGENWESPCILFICGV